MSRFQVHSVPDDHALAEGQSRLGTIPLHEFVNRIPIAALSIRAGKAVESRRFCGFEVGQPLNRCRGTFPFRRGFLFMTRGLQTPQANVPRKRDWRERLAAAAATLAATPEAPFMARLRSKAALLHLPRSAEIPL